MRNIRSVIPLIALAFTLCSQTTTAQQPREQPDLTIDAAARTEVIDGGGSPAMVALISSYLFNRPTHLNDLYWREGERTHQWWTAPYVPGKRYGDKDVYILTSNRTFSAAEEFTFPLTG